MSDARPVLSIRGLSKQFAGQTVLEDVSLELYPGEIHAVIGENGSGKSTLIKCLAGYYEPEPGAEIELAGEVVEGDAAARLQDGALAFVHQDLALIPTLSVTENLALGSGGFETGNAGPIPWRREGRKAVEILRAHGLEVAPETRIQHLSLADQTLVAIARALTGSHSGSVLVLDEPTAALPQADVERLLGHLRALAAKGVAILYVSHRLDELFAVSDRITVLRDGRKVGTFQTGELDERSLVRHIVGGEPARLYPDSRPTVGGEPLLKVHGLTGNRLRDASFEIMPGEIVGLAGLIGSGRSELARLLFGAQEPVAGAIELNGTVLHLKSPRDAVRAGICYVPENRRLEGSIQSMTLGENLTVTDLKRFTRMGRLQRRAERTRAEELVAQFKIRPPQVNRRFATLSGGNQQKAVLAKWLSLSPDLILLDEPVNGIDIGARSEVYGIIEQAAEGGAGVLMISSEIDDLTQLCARVLVLRRGSIVAELQGTEKNRDQIMNLAFTGRAI